MSDEAKITNVGPIVRAIIKERRAVASVSLPESGSPVHVRLLTDAEVSEGNVDAFAFITKQCKAKDIDPSRYIDALPDALAREQVRQAIFRAFRHPEDVNKTYFDSVDAVRNLDATYVQALYDLYVDHMDRKSTAKTLADDAIEAFVGALVDDPSLDYQLAQVEGSTLIRVVRFMVRAASSASKGAASE